MRKEIEHFSFFVIPLIFLFDRKKEENIVDESWLNPTPPPLFLNHIIIILIINNFFNETRLPKAFMIYFSSYFSILFQSQLIQKQICFEKKTLENYFSMQKFAQSRNVKKLLKFPSFPKYENLKQLFNVPSYAYRP